MQKKLFVSGIVLVLFFIGLSGCTENRTQKIDEFAVRLPDIDEFVKMNLANIYKDINEYDGKYKWSALMNFAFFTETMIDDMENYEIMINGKISDIENDTEDFDELKSKMDENQLTDDEIDLINQIETSILDFETNIDKINSCLNAMTTYRQFVNLSSVKLVLLEDYLNTLSLMYTKVESEEYKDALDYPDQLIQYCNDMKTNDQQKGNLNMVNYGTETSRMWNLYIKSWELYEDYLNLLIKQKYSIAESKYTEFSEKYSEAYEIEATQNINKLNNDLDAWYHGNIGIYIDLFEEYHID